MKIILILTFLVSMLIGGHELYIELGKPEISHEISYRFITMVVGIFGLGFTLGEGK